MDRLLSALGISSKESLKRALAALVAMVWPVVAPWLGAKAGIDITTEQAIAGSAALAVFIWQSGHKSAAEALAAGDAAAAKVSTLEDALAELSKPPPEGKP